MVKKNFWENVFRLTWNILKKEIVPLIRLVAFSATESEHGV